jgi:hypothetical protein
MDRDATSSDSLLFDTAARFANDVAIRLNDVAPKRSKIIVRKLSPYSQPTRCYGFHAARFEFAIKYFGIRFNNMLDFGSHPGACAASAVKYCDSVTCVSKKPSVDVRDFCPYVVRDDQVRLIQMDANKFVPLFPFDLLHDDVDRLGARTEADDVEIGLEAISRAKQNFPYVEQCLFTVKATDWQLVDALYDLYRTYGYIDFVKPLYSNPWKAEYMVYCRSDKVPRMRRAAFVRMFNAFLNSMAKDLFVWSELMLTSISAFEGIGRIEPNPNQKGDYEEEWIKKF